MRNFLRRLMWIGMVLLALLVTAISCNKDGDDKNTANNKNNANNSDSGGNTDGNTAGNTAGNTDGNTGGNTGGNNGGNNGGTTRLYPEIAVTNIDTSVVYYTGGAQIYLKLSGLPSKPLSADIANTTMLDVVNGAASDTVVRVFDLVISDSFASNANATGGFIFPSDPQTPGITGFTLDAMNKDLSSYDPGDSQGRPGTSILNSVPTSSDGFLSKRGWNLFRFFKWLSGSGLLRQNAFYEHFGVQPVFFCRTTISTITDANNLSDTTKLTGGQRASCYVAILGETFTDLRKYQWKGSSFSDLGFMVGALRTDDKGIAELGFSKASSPAGKVNDFKDGLDATEIANFTNANPYFHSTTSFRLGIIKDAGFTYEPPMEITIKPVLNVSEVDDTTTPYPTIKIKASGFPSRNVDGSDINSDLNYLLTKSVGQDVTRVFNIELTSGTLPVRDAWVLVGPGNYDAQDFTLPNPAIDQTTNVEGIYGTKATESVINYHNLGRGWNIFGIFMNPNPPTSTAQLAADVSPFAFTGITTTRPIFYCKTGTLNITSVDGIRNNTLLDLSPAMCYVSAFGTDFQTAGSTWMGATQNSAGTSFIKREFLISVFAFSTDDTTINRLGLPAATSAAAFRDGIDRTEMQKIIAANPGKIIVKKYFVKLVN